MHIPNYKGNDLKFEVHPNRRSASHGCLAASSYSKSHLKLLGFSLPLVSIRFHAKITHPPACRSYAVIAGITCHKQVMSSSLMNHDESTHPTPMPQAARVV